MATINELKQMINDPEDLAQFILDAIGEDYNGGVGLRGLYNGEKSGKCKRSYEWVDGNRTNKRLGGTCAVMIASNWRYESWSVIVENIAHYAKNVFDYGNGRVALVIGDDGENGEDIGEIVIPGAKVVYIWE